MTKDFPTLDVLSTITGVLVSEGGIGGVYEVLNFMTGEGVYTHQLQRGFQYHVGIPTRRRPVSVDQACVDLAEHFLSGVRGASKEDVQELAEEIQRRCEDACNEIESTERAR